MSLSLSVFLIYSYSLLSHFRHVSFYLHTLFLGQNGLVLSCVDTSPLWLCDTVASFVLGFYPRFYGALLFAWFFPWFNLLRDFYSHNPRFSQQWVRTAPCFFFNKDQYLLLQFESSRTSRIYCDQLNPLHQAMFQQVMSRRCLQWTFEVLCFLERAWNGGSGRLPLVAASLCHLSIPPRVPRHGRLSSFAGELRRFCISTATPFLGNFWPPTSGLQLHSSNLWPPTYGLRLALLRIMTSGWPPTSGLQLLASNFWPPTSGLQLLAFG